MSNFTLMYVKEVYGNGDLQLAGVANATGVCLSNKSKLPTSVLRGLLGRWLWTSGQLGEEVQIVSWVELPEPPKAAEEDA